MARQTSCSGAPSSRRTFLQASLAALTPAVLAPLAPEAAVVRRGSGLLWDDRQGTTSKFELPPLPYGYAALEPHMDELTVRIHHDRHHAGYVNNLNAAIDKHPELFKKSLEELLANLDSVPEDIRVAVRNNGGQVYNHNMYWACMAPGAGGEATGPVGEAIRSTFGSFEAFKTQFTRAAVNQFGSGWGWLVRSGGRLAVESTSNEGCPIMQGKTPLLVVDVWEHAYYLKYQNRRADFVAAWWNLVNWAEVNRRFTA